MKVLVVCAALLVAAQGATVFHYGTGIGSSSGFHGQDAVGNYNFGYSEGHGSGATFRKESGSPGVKVGSYGLTDADGRQRIVNYVADAAGFRANIQTNEPGVDASKDPANTAINKVASVVAPVVAAPAHYAAHYAAAPFHYGAQVYHAGAPHFAYGYTF